MSARRRAIRAAIGPDGRRRPPKRSRAAWYCVLVLSVGAFSGLAASFDVWPFGGLQAVASRQLRPAATSSQLQATAIFPTVGPLHEMLNLYDTAPPGTAPSAEPDPTLGSLVVINFPPGPMSAIEATCEAAKQAAENQSEAYKQSVEVQCEAAKQAYEQTHP